ncbi:MAG: glycosyltransferase 87 family protein [Thermoleophilaceae bacterium]
MRVRAWGAFAGIVALSAMVAWNANATWDYPTDAGPPIDALIHGRIHDFLTASPAMGPLSLFFRAPFAVLSRLTTPNDLFYDDVYRFGVFPCLVVAGMLGLLLARWMRNAGRPAIERFAVVALCMINPVSLRAVDFGHPEEILGGCLVVGSALAGLRGRTWLAAILLCAALLNKQWAVVAIVPVALTMDLRRLRTPAIALAGAGVLVLVPFLAVDAGPLFDVTKRLADLRHTFVLPASVWWPFFDRIPSADAAHHVMPDWLGVVARPLLLLVCFGVALGFAKRVRRDPWRRALPLLALVLLVRCMIDPLDNGYYHVPFFLALVAADAISGRLVASLVATGSLFAITKLGSEPSVLNALYLCWALPFSVYLAGRAWGVDWAALLRSRGVRGRAAAQTVHPS